MLLGEAVAAGLVVEEVFVDPDSVSRAEIVVAVAEAVDVGASAWITGDGLRGLVDVSTPQGVAAVARIPVVAGPAADGSAPLHLVLVGVSDPGNVGTLLRSAEAVGATVTLCEATVDPWAPKVVRASAGSVLRIPVRSGVVSRVLEEMGDDGVRLVGTVGTGGRAPDEVDLTGPVALVLGGEAHGLPPHVVASVDELVSLPMAGAVESLNVAVAGSVLAFEAVRQRRPDPVQPEAVTR